MAQSAFYWGYSVGQIPASYVIQRVGAKWIFGLRYVPFARCAAVALSHVAVCSVAIPSFLTMLVPVASRHSFGLALFIRCIIGFFESATFPAVFHFFPVWVPQQEKTFMIPAIVSGMYMGNIIGFSVSGVLADSSIVVAGTDLGGWPAVFYLFGALGVAWFPYWAYMAYEAPADHPGITMEELAYISQGKQSHLVTRHQSTARRGVSRAPASPSPDFSTYAAAHSPMLDAANPMQAGHGALARSVSLGEGNVVLNADWDVSGTSATVSHRLCVCWRESRTDPPCCCCCCCCYCLSARCPRSATRPCKRPCRRTRCSAALTPRTMKARRTRRRTWRRTARRGWPSSRTPCR